MSAKLNDTSSYHINEMETLGWELTICNSLEPKDSPCREVLHKKNTFGNLLFDYLYSIIQLSDCNSVIEVGGGYGYLMRDFLLRNPDLQPVMLDISSYLLNEQKKTIKGVNVEFIEQNFFSLRNNFLSQFDFAILNEIIGDFPTICSISKDDLNSCIQDNFLSELLRLIQNYSLPIPECKEFNFNLGALQAVEKLCKSGIKYVYLSEHSCEAKSPDEFYDKLVVSTSGYPERISLKGHDEYTIKFSYIEKIAHYYNYHIIRGNYTDFISINYNDTVEYILSTKSLKDEHEIIRHFIEDLFLYEYMILIRE